MNVNPVLKDFFSANKRFKTLWGGRASSKSYNICLYLLWVSGQCKMRILCTRKYQNKISESIHKVLSDQINRYDLENEFEIQRTKIFNKITGSEFLFMGIQCNTQELKSLEGINLCFIEEAQSITSAEFSIINPTIRAEGSQILIAFNPMLATDFIYKKFVLNTPKNAITQHINYDENPYLSNTILEEIAETKRTDLEAYNHIYLGQVLSNDENSIIKREWIVSAIDSHIKLNIKPVENYVLGFDVADDGADTNCTTIRKGCYCEDLREWNANENELVQSTKKIFDVALEKNAKVVFDSVGVGAGVGSIAEDLNKNLFDEVEFTKFSAGASVHDKESYYKPGIRNKDHFFNLKAQSWVNVADRLKETYLAVNDPTYEFREDMIISINSKLPHLEKLITELSTPKREFDNSMRIKVESKKDLASRGVPSPNQADAFILAFTPFVTSRMTRKDFEKVNRIIPG